MKGPSMGNPLTKSMGNILTTLMGNVLTKLVGKVLDIYTQRVGGDAGRLAVVAEDADVKVRIVEQDPQLGLLRRVLVGLGLGHPEGREGVGRLPDRIGEEAVDPGPLIDADGFELRGKNRG